MLDILNRFSGKRDRDWGGSGKDSEFGVGRCKLLDLEWRSNEVRLYSAGNSIQSTGIEHDGR